jgi:predicted RNA-binding Zn-ribbon protein involved in translation (DUF1610 family)
MMNTRNFFKNIKEIGKMVRVGSPSHPVIQVCPVCFIDSLSRQTSFLTFIVPTTYLCHNCGYTGPIFAEVDFEEYPRLLEEMSKETALVSSDMEESNNDS